MPEAVLAHVVAQAGDERGVHLRGTREQRRDAAADAVGVRGGGVARGRLGQREARDRRHLPAGAARGGALARVAQPLRLGGVEVDRRKQQLLAELRRARDHLAVVVEHERVPVEDELVLAADERAERDGGDVVARPLGEHPLALEPLAGVVGRGRDVDDQRRPGARLERGGRARLPDVLADRQPDLAAAELDQCRATAALEVALLVEDAVVGQVQLAVDRLHGAAGDHRERVVDVVLALGEADERDDPLGRRRDAVQRRARVAQEVLLEQQVLWRVAGQRKLGEEHELGAGLAGAVGQLDDRALVAGDVAHDCVHLREGDPQGSARRCHPLHHPPWRPSQ